MLTVYGLAVLTFMMLMYALERRDRSSCWPSRLGCALSSSYGFASGAWPFGVVEAIWCAIALHRYWRPPLPPPMRRADTGGKGRAGSPGFRS